MPIFWNTTPPTECQNCKAALGTVFYDMRIHGGRWAILCTDCAQFGPGCGVLGMGYGQKFEKQADGRFVKTEG